VAIKCTWDQPPTASIISLTSMKARKLKFIGVAWRVSGDWRVS